MKKDIDKNLATEKRKYSLQSFRIFLAGGQFRCFEIKQIKQIEVIRKNSEN